MAWTDCYLMFLLALTVCCVNSHPVPKNDLISGDDFLSILVRGDRSEEFYRETSRVARFRQPLKETREEEETPLPLETLFAPFKKDEKQYYETASSSSSSSEATTTSTEIPSTTFSSTEETTIGMEVVTSVEISSSVQEEIKIHTKRPKSKHQKGDDSSKSDSSHFQTIISAPEFESNSEFLYSSIPRSRMQRRQDSGTPYHQTIIHHDDKGTISFSSLNIPSKEGQKQRSGSWWWYGWNYPHLAKSSTTTTTTTEKVDFDTTEEPTTMEPTTTEEFTTISTTSTSSSTTPATSTTERIILHDLNKIPYDKLNAPVDDDAATQKNDLHAALGKFVPSSCKQQLQQQQQHKTTISDEIKSPVTHFVSLDDENSNNSDDGLSLSVNNEKLRQEEQKTDDNNANDDNAQQQSTPHSYRSTEEEDDAKFGYVVEGRNYRKYRVEEKTSDGYLVGEYGVLSHNDGSLRGVRYTADSNINPRLIHDALMKFLSL